jgi:Fe-S oxidoreductase
MTSPKASGKKAAQIKDTGADVLATGCPACMIQISDMLSQAGAKIAVRHPIELLAEALENENTAQTHQPQAHFRPGVRPAAGS